MEAVLLVVHLIVALGIIAVVLLQPSEAGGFLGSSGSMSNMMAPRRGGDVLTRVTTVLAGCFFMTSLLLAIIASHKPSHKSIVDLATGNTPPTAAAMEKKAASPTAEPAKAEEGAATAPVAKTEEKPKASKKPETPKAPISK